MGVVYHPVYLSYFEIGRTELIRDMGLPYAELEQRGWRLVVIDVGCRYLRPARYDDEITVRTTVTAVSAARVRFEYEVSAVASGTLLATGHSELASVNHDGRPRRFSGEFRERLTQCLTKPDVPAD